MRVMFWAGFWAFLLDQASKYLVIHTMGLARIGAIDVLPPLLNFRYVENRGVNFGLFGDDSDITRWALIALSLVICAVVIWWLRKGASRWMMLSAGLLIGGALGNVMDRLIYGYVLDFLNMSCCGFSNPYAFNVADIFVFSGAFGLIIFDAKSSKKKSA